MTATLSRRALLAAGGGLMVSWPCPPPARAAGPAPDAAAKLPGSLQTTPMLDAWIKVAPDGGITVFTGKAELGQGLKTALLQIAAEGLHVAPGTIHLVTADTGLTPDEGITSGSHSMQDSGTAILHAATQARALLQGAAAARLGVAADTLVLADGVARAPDGRTIGYGPLAEGLALHIRAQPTSPLDDPAGYRVLGTGMPRVDIPGKLTGGAAYVQDLRLPGMLHARIVRQPSAGAVLLAVDDAPVLACAASSASSATAATWPSPPWTSGRPKACTPWPPPRGGSRPRPCPTSAPCPTSSAPCRRATSPS